MSTRFYPTSGAKPGKMTFFTKKLPKIKKKINHVFETVVALTDK